MFTDKYWAYIPLVMLVVGLVVFYFYFEVAYPNNYILVFLAGALSTSGSLNRMLRWLYPLVIVVISGLVVANITSNSGIEVNKLIQRIALLPFLSLVLFYLGQWIGGLMYKRFPLGIHVTFVFYSYIFFVFLLIAFLQDLVYTIVYFSIFSFGYSYYLLSKGQNLKEIAKIFSVIPLFHILLYIFGANAYFFGISLPIFAAIFFGILGGWFLYRRNNLIGWIAVFILVFVIGAGGMSLVSFNTFNVVSTTHKNEAVPNVPLSVLDSTLMLSDFKGKVLVLDVWHRQCGVCFQKFPDFNTLSNRYKGNKDVQFFAMNHPIGSDNYTKSLKKMETLAYDFEHLYLPSDTIAGKLGVQFYPTLLVINKDQTRYVMTQIELSPWVYNNTSVIIDQMLAE